MAAANTDKFKKAKRKFETTVGVGGILAGGTTLPLTSVTGLDTTTAVTLVVGAGTATEEVITGVVSGSSLINCVRGKEGTTDSAHSAGETVNMYFTETHWDDVMDGILVDHKQDGTHSDINADSITATTGTFTNLTIAGTATPEGWSALGATPDTVTALGNRSYSMVFNGTDLTDTLSPGMRLKMTRTVTAPTQCADLEASSSQYFSKSSPAGMTFTDDFVVSAWVKLESYGSGNTIASRYNGTSGWLFYIESNGTLNLNGYNAGGANYSKIASYQSLPLNKWVHVAAQLDMSTFTATTTTSYMMIDGVDVPAIVSRAGTNPTALIQAGNLEIGGYNGGTLPFDGKLAQVAIYSAKVTQATILASMNQTLSGSETSLISAYSFNSTINDLSATANNLTANGGALATNADSPFALSLAGVPTGTAEYAEITSVTFSTNTTLSVLCPPSSLIPTTGGISAIGYSTHNMPFGWTGSKNGIVLGCQLYKSVDQSTTSTGSVAITFDGELFDNLGFHDRSSNTSRITIPSGYDGWYRVTGRLKFSGGTAGSRLSQLFKNGGVYTMNRYAYTATASDHTSTIDELIYLAADDYVELYAYVDGGGTYTFQGGCPPDQDHTLFSIEFVGK